MHKMNSGIIQQVDILPEEAQSKVCLLCQMASFRSHTRLLSLARDEPSFISETSFVRAPLNSRVSMSPSVSLSKGKAKAEALDRVSIEIQEALILEDLLFVLMVSTVL